MNLPRQLAWLAFSTAVLHAVPGEGETILPLRIVTEERLPFSRGQLLEAVRLRLTALGPSPTAAKEQVVVRLDGVDGVTVEFRYKRRTLALSGQRGRAAARRVALAIIDLVRDELALVAPVPPSSRPRSTPTTSRPRLPPPSTRPPSAAPPSAPVVRARPVESKRWVLGPLVTVGGGSNGDQLLLSVLLDGTLQVRGSWRAALDAGLALTPSTAVSDVPLRLWGMPLRAGVAWEPSRWRAQARATATVWPYWLRAGDAASAASDSGVLFGLGASAFYRLPLFGPVDALFGAGLDVFFNRVQFLVRGVPALATERVALWAGAGLALGPRP